MIFILEDISVCQYTPGDPLPSLHSIPLHSLTLLHSTADGAFEYPAHYVDAYFQRKLFIVADGPSNESTRKFWQMVWDENCTCIVMLTPIDDEVSGISY